MNWQGEQSEGGGGGWAESASACLGLSGASRSCIYTATCASSRRRNRLPARLPAPAPAHLGVRAPAHAVAAAHAAAARPLSRARMEAEPALATVGCLSRECLALVFAQLDPEDLAAAACASAAWARALASPELEGAWAAAGARAYLLPPGRAPAAGPDGAPRATHRAAAAAWGPYFRRYGALGRRAAAAWRALERWTAAHAPAVRASLRRGATEAELDAFEAALIAPYPREPLAPAVRALYAFHDGQELAFDRGLDARRPEMGPSAFHGLFGGYAFYSHVVSTRMLPLARALRWARALPASTNAEGLIFPFAASFNFAKVVYVHVESGVPCAATLDREALIPAVPALLHEEGPDPHYDTAGALRWVEAYAAALEGGRFGVERLADGEPRSEGISLFPRTALARSEAVTRGVRIRAAALFVPEQSTLPPAWRFAAAAAGALARARPADAAAVPGAEGEGEAQVRRSSSKEEGHKVVFLSFFSFLSSF
jgi:F-box protein 3